MSDSPKRYDAVIVGAGFSGMYMLYRLRELGFSCRVYEAADGVGGTWYWNRYPGARCDSESMYYSYSFSSELEQEWNWTERYPAQPEILTYLNHVADRFDLRPDIQFNTRINSAVFDESANEWTVTTSTNEIIAASFCIMATGCLSLPNAPKIKGIDDFKGAIYHTGQWPHEGVDFTGKKVGIIGTGSSGIQAIPIIAEQAEHLTVFQRTPNFMVPAHNGPLDPEFERDWKANYDEWRRKGRESFGGFPYPAGNRSALELSPEEQLVAYEEAWKVGGFRFLSTFYDLIINEQANETAAEFVRSKIAQIVKDPETARKLMPRDYPIGTKRLALDTNYFQTYNRDNVTLVDIKTNPIDAITSNGIRTDEADYELDAIVFATGFDAMTGALSKIDIRGRANVALKEKWEEGPKAYLGLGIAGFPNLFTITGPGSPSVLSNMPVSIEQHVDWITDCLIYLRDRKITSIEATTEAEEAWVAHVNEVAGYTLFPKANSWYIGANIPGKPRVFMPYVGGVGPYRARCNEIAAKEYEGFALSK